MVSLGCSCTVKQVSAYFWPGLLGVEQRYSVLNCDNYWSSTTLHLKGEPNLQSKGPNAHNRFFQDFERAWNACNVYAGATMWLRKHYLSGLVEPVIKARFALPTETSKAQEGCLMAYCQLSLNTIRDGGLHCDSRRWHPNLKTKVFDTDLLRPKTMNEDTPMWIHLLREDIYWPFHREG